MASTLASIPLEYKEAIFAESLPRFDQICRAAKRPQIKLRKMTLEAFNSEAVYMR